MQRTDNLHASIDLSRGFELTKALVAGRDYLGEVFVQREGSNLLEKGVESRSCDSSS